MIERLHRLARRLRKTQLPALVGAVVCLLYGFYVLLMPASHENDYLLTPAIVGMLWCLSLYALITNFVHIPVKAPEARGWWQRFKGSLARGYYWLLGLIFIALSVGVLVVSWRLMAVWLREYGG
jgi:hypothetical protein